MAVLARIEYSPKNCTWMVKFAGCGHESLRNMNLLYQYGDSSYWPVDDELEEDLPLPGPPHIHSFGAAEMTLANGTKKAPDDSLIDDTPGKPIRLKGWPTVVFEMAWSQTSKELAEICGRWVAGSEAKVNLAIGIDVILKYEKPKREKDKKGKKKEEKVEGGENKCEDKDDDDLQKAEIEEEAKDKDKEAKGNLKKRKQREPDKEIAQLWVTLWEVVEAEPLMNTSEPINELLRADGQQEDPLILTDVPPATMFTFVSPFTNFPEQIGAIGHKRFKPLEPPLFVKYHVAEAQRLQVHPFILLFIRSNLTICRFFLQDT